MWPDRISSDSNAVRYRRGFFVTKTGSHFKLVNKSGCRLGCCSRGSFIRSGNISSSKEKQSTTLETPLYSQTGYGRSLCRPLHLWEVPPCSSGCKEIWLTCLNVTDRLYVQSAFKKCFEEASWSQTLFTGSFLDGHVKSMHYYMWNILSGV